MLTPFAQQQNRLFHVAVLFKLPISIITRELTQQDGWKTQDGRMTKKCGARLCIPNLTGHLFVIVPS